MTSGWSSPTVIFEHVVSLGGNDGWAWVGLFSW